MVKKPWRMGSTKLLVTTEVLSTHKRWSFSKAWGLRTYSVQSQGLLQRKVNTHRPVSWGLPGGNGSSLTMFWFWCHVEPQRKGKNWGKTEVSWNTRMQALNWCNKRAIRINIFTLMMTWFLRSLVFFFKAKNTIYCPEDLNNHVINLKASGTPHYSHQVNQLSSL